MASKDNIKKNVAFGVILELRYVKKIKIRYLCSANLQHETDRVSQIYDCCVTYIEKATDAKI